MTMGHSGDSLGSGFPADGCPITRLPLRGQYRIRTDFPYTFARSTAPCGTIFSVPPVIRYHFALHAGEAWPSPYACHSHA